MPPSLTALDCGGKQSATAKRDTALAKAGPGERIRRSLRLGKAASRCACPRQSTPVWSERLCDFANGPACSLPGRLHGNGNLYIFRRMLESGGWNNDAHCSRHNLS